MTEAGAVERIHVGGEAPYDVLVGAGAVRALPDVVPAGVPLVAVVAAGLEHVAAPALDALCVGGRAPVVLTVPAGERAKTLDVVAGLYDGFAQARLTRDGVVVAVGGGATTDAVGFAAATWLRGVRVVHVPTTLLAMVDAAVGGKTGVNVAAGKNLVGAFHPPHAVVADPEVLRTLPAAEWVNGLAEVVKAGFIADERILRLVEEDVAAALDPTSEVARELVRRAIRVKVDVVGADLRESGVREHLNYGHTLGHALERHQGYRLPHGHAVSVGMVFAAELARAAGRLDAAAVDRHRAVLASVGLPTSYDAAAWPQLRATMTLDKKARGATLRFVVLDAVARPAILAAPDEAWLEQAWGSVGR